MPCSLTFFPAVSYMIPTFQVKTEDEKKMNKINLLEKCLFIVMIYIFLHDKYEKEKGNDYEQVLMMCFILHVLCFEFVLSSHIMSL